MNDENQIMILRYALTAFYAGGWSAIMRRADIWYPFTPVYSMETGRWVGLRDAFRFALSTFFFVILPAAYLIYSEYALSRNPPPFFIRLLPPSFGDALKILVVLSLVAPQLGFYDIWQVIMRSRPGWFYSEGAIARIREHYPSAFETGHGATMAWALTWILVPTLVFICVLWAGGH